MSGLKNRPSNFITSWLAAILVRTIVCRYVSYRRRILSRSGSYCPIAYRPTRLQYVLESLGLSPAPLCFVVAPDRAPSGVSIVPKPPLTRSGQRTVGILSA